MGKSLLLFKNSLLVIIILLTVIQLSAQDNFNIKVKVSVSDVVKNHARKEGAYYFI